MTNIGCSSDTVKVLNSHATGELSTQLKNKIARMLKTQSDFINIEYMDVAEQQNGKDCGVYAIANALDTCRRNDPSVCNWKDTQMRKHLLRCLDDEELISFPQSIALSW